VGDAARPEICRERGAHVLDRRLASRGEGPVGGEVDAEGLR